MTIVAFDLGSTLGYYIDDKHRMALSIKFKKDTRFLEFYDFLVDRYTEYATIAYEDAKFQPGNAAPVFHGFVAIIKLFALQNNIKVVPIPVGTIKKHITGYGNADKEQMMECIRKRGYEFTDHNAADAIGVYLTYKALYENA